MQEDTTRTFIRSTSTTEKCVCPNCNSEIDNVTVVKEDIEITNQCRRQTLVKSLDWDGKNRFSWRKSLPDLRSYLRQMSSQNDKSDRQIERYGEVIDELHQRFSQVYLDELDVNEPAKDSFDDNK